MSENKYRDSDITQNTNNREDDHGSCDGIRSIV